MLADQRLPAQLGLAARAGCSAPASAAARGCCATKPSANVSTPPGSTLPLIGKLSRGYNAARFAGTLAMLAGAGVPILKALQAAAETLSNRAMRADAMDALVQVREGAPLASALAGKKRFPGLLAMFSRLGEQTGQLPQMLDRAARQLGIEVQRRAMQMATILEPLLIVAMGAGGDADRAGGAAADHPAQHLGQVMAVLEQAGQEWADTWALDAWAESDPNADRSVHKRFLRAMVLRFGRWKACVVVTMIGILASLAMSLVINLLIHRSSHELWVSLLMSAGIPALIAPPVTWLVISLLQDAERARRAAEWLSVTDPLTGAFNRRHFFVVGERRFAHALAGPRAGLRAAARRRQLQGHQRRARPRRRRPRADRGGACLQGEPA